MRYLALQNQNEETIVLNGENGIWFSNLTGLGITNEINTVDLGSGFFRNIDTGHPPSQSVPGDLFIMPPDADQKYRNFVNWIQAATKLTLVYRPFGSETFYRLVHLEYLQKGVPEKTGRLTIPTCFRPLTPWYKPTPMDISMGEAETNITTFSFEFNQYLHFPASTGQAWSGTLTPAGHIPAAIKFDYTGSATNLQLTLTGENSGTVYGECKVTGEINGFSFSSVPYDAYVREGDGDEIYDLLNPGVDPYIRLPLTEPCTVALAASNNLTGSASASVYYFYRSV